MAATTVTPAPILALTDFSEPAALAARRAAALAREQGRPLRLVHALGSEGLAELRGWLGQASSAEQSLRQAAEQQLAALGAALAAELAPRAGTPVLTTLLQGADGVADALTAEADAADAALLVLAARGAGTWRRLLLGGTAERLLRRVRRPLLVVKNQPAKPAAPYRRVLVAVDRSPWSGPALAAARAVAPEAELVLCGVFQVPFAEKLRFAGVDDSTMAHYRRQARLDTSRALETLAAEAGLTGPRWRSEVVEGDAAQTLVELAAELRCDLVVLGKHGRSATGDLLLGSVTQRVLSEAEADVLVSGARAEP